MSAPVPGTQDAPEAATAATASVETTPQRNRKLSIVIPLVVGLFALVVFGAFGVQILRRTETAAAKPVPAATRAAATEVAAAVQVGGFPQGVAVNEANGTLYVTKSVPNTAKPSADSDDAEADRTPGTVVAVNMGSRSVSKEMTVGVEPNRIVVGVGGNYVYSTNTGSGTVSVVDAGAGQVIDTIKVETHPRGIALNPKLELLYVANTESNSVSVIDARTRVVVDKIDINPQPYAVAFESTHDLVMVSLTGDGNVAVYDPVNPKAEFRAGPQPHSIAVDEALGAVYVTHWGGRTVSVNEARGLAWWDTITVGDRPYGVAVDNAARTVYITNWGSDTVSVVDANTRKVVNTIKVGSRPAGIAVDQPTGTVYVANSGDGSISVLTPAAQ